MNSNSEDNALPQEFDGKVRLFPLPNYVLFPGVVKGLHIFEPRYCAMLRDALNSDRLIAMATLSPGWESTYLGSPAIYDTVCIGRVIQHEVTADNRHNILLYGLKRARVKCDQIFEAGGYRVATTNPVDDFTEFSAEECEASRHLLCERTRRHESILPLSAKFFLTKLHLAPLGLVVDFLAHELPLLEEQKIGLLKESSIDKRCAWLLSYYKTYDVFGDGKDSNATDKKETSGGSSPNCSLN